MTAQPGWAGGRSAVGIVAAAAVALPWLNPFAPGPSATVMPWLVAALCALALALLAVAHGGRPPARLVLGAAMLALWAVLATPGWRPEPWMLASALAVVLAGATIPAQDGAESLARMVQGG
jgi:hypothetical protein